jgi:hypothetical protein
MTQTLYTHTNKRNKKKKRKKGLQPWFLPSICEALDSILNTERKKKQILKSNTNNLIDNIIMKINNS